MTINELSQLSALNNEIRLLQNQIDALRLRRGECTTHDSILASSRVEPYQQHVQVISGVGTSGKAKALSRMIGDRKAQLGATLIKREQERARLEHYIAGIPDSLTRQVFTLRFVEGLSWQGVADKAGCSEGSAKMMVRRYIDHA